MKINFALTILAVAFSTSVALATCYVSDAPNIQSCGTANVTSCSVTVLGKNYPGMCQDSPAADAITTASTGQYEVTGLSCECSCQFYIVDHYDTVNAPDGKNFNGLDSGSTSACPGS